MLWVTPATEQEREIAPSARGRVKLRCADITLRSLARSGSGSATLSGGLDPRAVAGGARPPEWSLTEATAIDAAPVL